LKRATKMRLQDDNNKTTYKGTVLEPSFGKNVILT
jgi:hypothetical protein